MKVKDSEKMLAIAINLISKYESFSYDSKNLSKDLANIKFSLNYLAVQKTIPNWNNFNINQQAALLSFVYTEPEFTANTEKYKTLNRALNSKTYDNIRNAFMLYTNPGSPEENRLRRRRAKEATLFEARPYTTESTLFPVKFEIDNQDINIEFLDQIDWNDLDFPITRNFKLGEFLLFDYKRIPLLDSIKSNILYLSNELQKIRDDYGESITITSGYRSTDINSLVGGLADSHHIFGNAVDIRPTDPNASVYEFQEFLDDNWYGALGYGAKHGFVHIDTRNGYGWKNAKVKGERFYY